METIIRICLSHHARQIPFIIDISVGHRRLTEHGQHRRNGNPRSSITYDGRPALSAGAPASGVDFGNRSPGVSSHPSAPYRRAFPGTREIIRACRAGKAQFFRVQGMRHQDSEYMIQDEDRKTEAHGATGPMVCKPLTERRYERSGLSL